MKLDNLRQLIKEEIAKALNKYDEGTTIVWKGSRVIVDKDNGEATLTVKPVANPEAKPKTVFRKDTHPVQEINEDTFHNGEKVLYDDKVYTVKKDNGNVGVEIIGDGEEKLVMRTQLTRVVKEDTPDKPRYNVSGLKENYINGVLGMIGDEPSLIGNMEVKKALMECLKQLDLEILQNLNVTVQQQSGKKFPPAGPSTVQNPYEDEPSRGYMGSKYRGD
jgi:hypothetical protein